MCLLTWRVTISPPNLASSCASQNPANSCFSKCKAIAFSSTSRSSQESGTNLPCLPPSGRPCAALPDRSCWRGSCQTKQSTLDGCRTRCPPCFPRWAFPAQSPGRGCCRISNAYRDEKLNSH